MEEQHQLFIEKIYLELKPKSRRCLYRLFRIRENRFFNKELFEREIFTNKFLEEFNKINLRKGQYIKCGKFHLLVKRIQYANFEQDRITQVEYLIKGIPFDFNQQIELDKINPAFIEEIIFKNGQSNKNEQIYLCYCSECKKCLEDGEYFVKTGHWNRPIVCLNCYDLLFTFQCVRCMNPITFHQEEEEDLVNDGIGTIRYVEHNELYWHSHCCVCVNCFKSLIGNKFYQDQIYNQLFCLDHIPNQYL